MSTVPPPKKNLPSYRNVLRQTQDSRTPKPGGVRGGFEVREASWSAPALWRFWFETPVLPLKTTVSRLRIGKS